MTVKLKNNASGTLSTAISSSDTGAALTSGDGANFPALGANEYFYATIVDTNEDYEIVKVTARSTDSLTIVRAQESTTARGFVAGSIITLKVTAQAITDAITDSTVSLSAANSWTGIQTFASATTEVAKSGAAAKLRVWDTTLANYHGFRNVAGVLTQDYTGTDYLTVTAAGVVAFVNAPKVGANGIYYATGTDVAVTDGGTGASTASTARTNLGLAIGTDVQAYHALLASFVGLTHAVDKLAYSTGAATLGITDFTAFGRTLVGSADAAAGRTNLALGTISTQAASSVAITGGTITGIDGAQIGVGVSSETSGTLTTLSKNKIVAMTGTCTLNASVFANPDMILFYAGSSSRTLTQGSGVTMRLGGTATTGSRTLAAYTLAVAYYVSASEVVISGNGVT